MGRGYSFQSFFLYIDFKTKRYYTFQQFKERGLGEREREREMRKREVRELFINLSESSVWGHIRTPDSQYVKMRKKTTCMKRAVYFQPKSYSLYKKSNV